MNSLLPRKKGYTICMTFRVVGLLGLSTPLKVSRFFLDPFSPELPPLSPLSTPLITLNSVIVMKFLTSLQRSCMAKTSRWSFLTRMIDVMMNSWVEPRFRLQLQLNEERFKGSGWTQRNVSREKLRSSIFGITYFYGKYIMIIIIIMMMMMIMNPK